MIDNYSLNITVDGYENFSFRLVSSAQDTFLSIHKAILDSVAFEGDQIASFQVCDNEWVRQAEITLVNMGDEEEPDLMLMEATLLGDVIQGGFRHFVYEYDFASQWRFFIEAGDYDKPAIEETPYLLEITGKAPLEEDGLTRSMEGMSAEDAALLAGLHMNNLEAFSDNEEWDEDEEGDEEDGHYDEDDY